MNHTTLERIVAISMACALAVVGVSMLSSPKAMAVTFSYGGYTLSTSNTTTSLQGPNGLNVGTEVPEINAQLPGIGAQLPDLGSQLPGSGSDSQPVG